MSPYAAFVWFVLLVCALGGFLAVFDLVVGWITDGSTDRPGGTR